MPTIIPTLDEAATLYRSAAQTVITVYNARRPAATAQVAPESLNQAIEKFFTISTQLERDPDSTGPIYRDPDSTGPIYKDNVSQLGDYAITLLADIASWAGQFGLAEEKQLLEATMLSVADWTVRHQGEIRSLEPIVNAAAARANRTQDPPALESLCRFITRVLHATSNIIKQDLEKTNPGRPWRVLHLNRSIVATRTHNPTLMTQVFDEFVTALPDDAPRFFAEGMQQMDALDYPAHVRAVMSRYFDRWTRKTMH